MESSLLSARPVSDSHKEERYASCEIRLHKCEGHPPAIHRVRRVSDFAAIRNARKIAETGEAVEVWKGEECIYADRRQPLSSLH
jgi:hypothetical protein